MNTIGERIWHILTQKRIKPQELADQLGVTKQYLYDIKSGRIKNPSYVFFNKFKEIGINPEWLMFGNGDPFIDESLLPSQIETKGMASEFYKKILDELVSLRRQLDMKDQQINKLIDILGKPNVSTEIPPVGQGAVVLPLFPLANSCANTRNLMIA